jgi:hypothetical protein
MKAANAESTLDHLESAVARAGEPSESKVTDATVDAEIELVDLNTLGINAADAYELEDILGRADAIYDPKNQTIRLKLHWEWPFALCLKPKV